MNNAVPQSAEAWKRGSFFVASVLLLFLASALPASAVGIDDTQKYAWGENIGWLNWGTPEGDVDAPLGSGALTGYVWGENVGWVSLNCSNTSSCGTVSYGVTKSGDNLSGYAWGENVGWVSFSCSNTASCGVVDYGVTIDDSTRDFSGYAWGENIGWISTNCSNTASCGTVDYKVSIDDDAAGGGGGGGFLPTPTPSATPAPTPTATPTGTPPPATPTPTGMPTPAPTATPTGTSVPLTPPPLPPSTPPPSTPPPSTPPPSTPPPSTSPSPGPITDVIGGMSDFIDWLGQLLFGPLGGLCPGPLGITACGATAMAVLAVMAAILAAIIQNEAAAALFSLLQIVGIHKKARVWGIVYDSATKHPVPAARIELLDTTGRILEVRFTDREGRYGFLTTPSSLNQQELKASIRVTKPGYRFPSTVLTSGTDYVVYENLYKGGEFVIVGDGLLNFSIPMDPLSPTRVKLSGYGRGLFGTIGERLLAFGFIIGVIAVPVNYYFVRTTTNLIILIVFFVVNGIRLAIMYRPYGVTVDAMTGKKLPFALVTLIDETGKRAGFAVSDEHGRYVLSAERGHQYEAVAYTPANTIPQRTVRQRIPKLSRIGRTAWVTLTLRI